LKPRESNRRKIKISSIGSYLSIVKATGFVRIVIREFLIEYNINNKRREK